jgi:hypothetical protein
MQRPLKLKIPRRLNDTRTTIAHHLRDQGAKIALALMLGGRLMKGDSNGEI